ncbi:hypothetical protein G6F56_012164 [Rhizopus delemar]|nr:hypothetical protein G6F56_012164 [Rhizopus delemar]
MSQLLSVVHNLIHVQGVLCVRAFLDFYIQITSKEHTEDTLKQADRYLDLFFEYLPIFQNVAKSSLNFPKIHMLTKYTNDIRMKGPVDGFSTNHGERLHKSYAKQPSKRTNQRNMKSFTAQLAKFVQTRDSFFDMYPVTTITEDQKEPHFLSQPWPVNNEDLLLQSPQQPLPAAEYILCSPQAKYKKFNDLKDIVKQLTLLKATIRLYLNSAIDHQYSVVRLGSTPSFNDVIKIFNQINIIDYNDDYEEEKNVIRARDDVLVLDYNNQRRFFSVHFFMTVTRENENEYGICVGQEFKMIQGSHPTGYQKLCKLRF